MKKITIKKAFKTWHSQIKTENYFGNSNFIIKGKTTNAIESVVLEMGGWADHQMNDTHIEKKFDRKNAEPYKGEIIKGFFYKQNVITEIGQNSKNYCNKIEAKEKRELVRLGDAHILATLYNMIVEFFAEFNLDNPVIFVTKDKVYFESKDGWAVVPQIKLESKKD